MSQLRIPIGKFALPVLEVRWSTAFQADGPYCCEIRSQVNYILWSFAVSHRFPVSTGFDDVVLTGQVFSGKMQGRRRKYAHEGKGYRSA